MDANLADMMYDEMISVISKYAGMFMDNATAIGVLEMVKMTVYDTAKSGVDNDE